MKEVNIISSVVGRDNVGKSVGSTAPSMGAYALKSELLALQSTFNDFLEGDDTDTVINRWKELEAFLNGISEDNTLSSILGDYIPIQGYTDILGEKNFTGGLKVNGSPIVYDADNKYWKLEGDLLVTGGVTMYADEGTYTPSTIMDAIAVDGTTISKDGGVLKVIGSVGGATTMGSLTNVGSWADGVAPQDRIMYQAANSSQWVAKNLSDLAVGGVTGDYLPLSGGTLTGDIFFVSSNAGGAINSVFPCHYFHRFWDGKNVYVHFYESKSNAGELNSVANLRVATTESSSFKTLKFSGDGTFTWADNKIWHAGNDGSGSGLDADLLDGKHYSDIINGNVASATKLQTARTIWGQSFNGTGNINGSLHLSKNNPIMVIADNGVSYNILNLDDSNNLTIGYGTAGLGYSTYIDGNDIFIRSGKSRTTSIYLNSSGNVGIGGTPYHKLHVYGNVVSEGGELISFKYIDQLNNFKGGQITLTGYYTKLSQDWSAYIASDYLGSQWCTVGGFTHGMIFKSGRSGFDNFIFLDSSGNPVARLSASNTGMNHHFVGNVLVTGGLTMYSQKSLKNVVDEKGLSLEELSAIKPTRYTWKDKRDDRLHFGGIADDVQKVLPEVVYKTHDGILTMDYGNAGFAIASSLINPVISHEARIVMLEEEIKRLREENEQLKWHIA